MIYDLDSYHRRQLFENGWFGVNIFYEEESGRFLTQDNMEIYNIFQIVPPWAWKLAQEAKRQGCPCFEFVRNSEIIRIVWWI